MNFVKRLQTIDENIVKLKQERERVLRLLNAAKRPIDAKEKTYVAAIINLLRRNPDIQFSPSEIAYIVACKDDTARQTLKRLRREKQVILVRHARYQVAP